MAISVSNIQPVQRGDQITAEQHNQIAALLNRLASISVGPGLELRATDAGLEISLAAGFEVRLPARIAAVNGAGGPSGLASDVTYDVRATGRPDIAVLPALTPVIGRPTKNDELTIHYAEVGDRCYLVPTPTQEGFKYELEVVTEVIEGAECSA